MKRYIYFYVFLFLLSASSVLNAATSWSSIQTEVSEYAQNYGISLPDYDLSNLDSSTLSQVDTLYGDLTSTIVFTCLRGLTAYDETLYSGINVESSETKKEQAVNQATSSNSTTLQSEIQTLNTVYMKRCLLGGGHYTSYYGNTSSSSDDDSDSSSSHNFLQKFLN